MNKLKILFKWYLNPYYWIFPYYISFVEEVIMNEKYQDCIGGRVEVFTQWSTFDIDEYRFFTRDKRFYKFRDKYDFANMSWIELILFKKKLKKFKENICL